jgi:hypothetical protein
MLLAPKAAAAEKRTKPEAATAEEVRELREMLQAQSEELRQLREEMGRMRAEQQALGASRQASDSRLAAAEASSSREQESFGKLESDVMAVQAAMASSAATAKDDQKRVAALEGTMGRFRFTGDVRLRYENFYQGGTQDRHRERIRLRFGVQGKLNEDFSAGLFLASGAVAEGIPSFRDPVSTNETLTSFFERKTVGFDRGWITYNPQAHKWLELTGGKWAYTWNRTALTFDNDLNPEGFSEKFNFDLKNAVLRNVNFTGLQIMFNELSGDNDSFAAGGAFSGRLQLGSRLTVTPTYSLLNWRNADVIAQAASPLGGGTRVINANLMTNATRNCGGPTPDAGCRAGGAPHREFASEFLYSDLILDTTVKTPWNRWPVRLLLEYEKNLSAISNQDAAFVGAIGFGQAKEKNDLRFEYAFSRIEQDAMISQFNESDSRASTNILQHRLLAEWKMQRNVTASYTLWIGRTLDCRLQNAALAPGFTCNPVAPFNTEPYLKRMQFDVIYSF